jgi:DNA helicase HerA-like ATPase
MGIGVLIIGKSGSGKSTSMRNFKSDEVGIINVISKPLPFKNVNGLKTVDTDNYADIKTVLEKSKAKSIVIDDAGYLITNQFMRKHANAGGGNAVFSLYNDIADNFWTLIEQIKALPNDKIVYLFMHEEKNEFGDISPKTIGKLINEKVCLEGLFSIVLRAKKVDKNYYFFTQSTENDVAKSPIRYVR